MPLDADAKDLAGRFDGLDDPVLGDGADPYAQRNVLRRLMMCAVHRQFVGSHDPVKLSPGQNPHDVSGLIAWIGLFMSQRAGNLVRNVLDQRAAERHVQQLLPPTDAEDGQPALQSTKGHPQLEGGASVLRGHRRMPLAGPEQRRIDVESTAGDDQAADQAQVVVNPLGLVRQQHRQSAGSGHGVRVVLAQREPRKL